MNLRQNQNFFCHRCDVDSTNTKAIHRLTTRKETTLSSHKSSSATIRKCARKRTQTHWIRLYVTSWCEPLSWCVANERQREQVSVKFTWFFLHYSTGMNALARMHVAHRRPESFTACICRLRIKWNMGKTCAQQLNSVSYERDDFNSTCRSVIRIACCGSVDTLRLNTTREYCLS